MKKFLLLSLPLYLLGLIYLSIPDPRLTYPENIYHSDEPGDTWQNPDQSAYYTNLARDTITSFHQAGFSLALQNFTIPSFRLNYRPEDTATYIRPHILAYYLEEVVHPLRESLFIGGWSPKLSPISAELYQLQRDRWELVRGGIEYDSRITLKPVYSPLWIRLLLWSAIFPLTYLVLSLFFTSLRSLLMPSKININT